MLDVVGTPTTAESAKQRWVHNLLAVKRDTPRGEIPGWVLDLAAADLGRSRDQVRRYVKAAGGGRDHTVWRFPSWMLPLLYAHGNVRALYDDLCDTRVALRAAGEDVPEELAAVPDSYSTFWRAVRRLPPRVQEFHKRGSKGFRRRLLYLRWEAGERNEIWQADCCRLDIWIVPRRHSNPLRPWLIVFLDDRTRVVPGCMLCLGQPTAEEVAATLARAVRLKATGLPGVMLGGLPQRILWDNGPEFRAELMTLMALRLHFSGEAVLRHTPTRKGKVERFFGTFQRWVLWGLPGYSKGPHSYTDRDLFVGDPSTLLDEVQLWSHINDRINAYNSRRPHRALGGRTPVEAWADDTTPLVEVPVEDLRLAMLMSQRPVAAQPDGVQVAGRIYIDPTGRYDDHIGTKVLVGRLPHDDTFVELFDLDGQWIATAYPHETVTAAARTAMYARRQAQYKELVGAAETAHALHLARIEALGPDGSLPGLVATGLSLRSTPVKGALAPAAPRQPVEAEAAPTADEAWLEASRRALESES